MEWSRNPRPHVDWWRSPGFAGTILTLGVSTILLLMGIAVFAWFTAMYGSVNWETVWSLLN